MLLANGLRQSPANVVCPLQLREKARERGSEGLRHLVRGHDSDDLLAPLYAADVGAVQAAHLGEPFLREAFLQAEPSHHRAEFSDQDLLGHRKRK
jgi:hypothetical protein